MRKCHHHYHWYNGKLKCERCGHRKWLTRGAKRKITITIIVLAFGFIAYQNLGLIINNVTHIEKILANIKIIPSSNTIALTPTTAPPSGTKSPTVAPINAPETPAPQDTVTNSNPPQINSQWVNSFISVVNAQRQQSGSHPLVERQALDNTAKTRFDTMVTHYQISHYGATGMNIGEVVFYPDGYTPQDYATNLQSTAPLHWQLLLDPTLSIYGYYIGTGPTIDIIGDCSVTEIPGPNIDERQFFQQHGCQTGTEDATWLVIDLNYGSGIAGSGTIKFCLDQHGGRIC